VDAAPDLPWIAQDARSDQSSEADGDGGGCWPDAIDEWKPTWKPPKVQPGVCSQQLVTDLAAACETDPGAPATCDALKRDLANTACLDCLYSVGTDSQYGAVIQYGHVVWANTSGCMALIDHDESPTGCGPRQQASRACGPRACDGPCLRATGAEYDACAHQAYETECKPYEWDGLCTTKPVYGPCSGLGDWPKTFAGFGKLFCVTGFGPVDAGGDADAGD
jgi:hypothetical protein